LVIVQIAVTPGRVNNAYPANGD